MKRAVLGLVLGLSVVACVPPSRHPERMSNPPQLTMSTQAPGANDPHMTTDGRTVEYGDEMLWCYVDSQGVFGGRCSATMALCDEELKSVHMREMANILRIQKKEFTDYDARLAAADYAVKRWPRCTEMNAVACFRVTDVVSGMEIRACTPTIRSCEKDLAEMKINADYTVAQQQCSLYRVP